MNLGFKDSLTKCVENSWNDYLFQSDFWKALQSGTYNKENYAAFLSQTYHYTRRSALIQASAIPHFQRKHRDLAGPFLRHATEEESHYRLCERDWSKLGLDKSDIINSYHLPPTEGYIGFAFNQINYISSISYLGYLFQLEYMAVKVGPEAVSMIKSTLPELASAMSFLLVHAEEDKDHVSELLELIDNHIVEPEDKEIIVYTAKTASCLYSEMMSFAFKHSNR